jgi:class 3 adenylate cyclase
MKTGNVRSSHNLPLYRWGLSLVALCFCWAITPFSIFERSISVVDFGMKDADSYMSLEQLKYRYDYVGQDEAGYICPGPACPLDPGVNPAVLKHETLIQRFFSKTVSAEGWRGKMYLRWDTSVPGFVRAPGEPIAFDFYGLAAKKWRFFVNGQEISSGQGAPSIDAINFPAPGPADSRLILGFELEAGRSLSPGIVVLAQPFLSRPHVAKYLRAAYLGLDKEHLIPISIPPTVLALLAAISCFLTPFYKEILAFSFWVTFINWRFLLINNLVPFPGFLNVDFVTFSSMLMSATLACQWAFLSFFFRVKSRIKWLPVAVYGAIVPVLWGAGLTGIGLDFIVGLYRNFEWQTALCYAAGAVMGFRVWMTTKKLAWAKYRRLVAFAVAAYSTVLTVAYLLMSSFLFGMLSADGLIPQDIVYKFMAYGPRGYILLVGFVIALEWAMIVRDRQRVLQRFGKVVDPRLVNDIIRGPEKESKLIPNAVVLFVDIRMFTTICEVMGPERVVKVLNEYLDVVTTAIQNHGGVVDKFVGDAVMAIWGVPEKGEQDAMAAVKAALDIRTGIQSLNERRIATGEFPIDVGIGIHAGPTIFGAMGNGVRVDHTVIGPTINIASRLESMTKDFGCDIVISYSVLADVEGNVLIEDVGLVDIRGMAAQVGAAKLIGVQVSDDDFVIGHDILEQVVTLRRPGRIVGTPNTYVDRNYRGLTVVETSTHSAA